MSVVLVCGARNSGYQEAFDILMSAGLTPASPSRREKATPQEITKGVLSANGISGSGNDPVQQIQPGQAWQILSTDLILGNSANPQWGWADPDLVYLLDYWKNFDPHIRFVLIYSPPEMAVAQLVHTDTEITDAVIRQELVKWEKINKELFRFHQENLDRCILINSELLDSAYAVFVEMARDKFGLSLSAVQQTKHSKDDHIPLHRLIAPQLTEEMANTGSLFKALENGAALPGSMTLHQLDDENTNSALHNFAFLDEGNDPTGTAHGVLGPVLAEYQAQKRSMAQFAKQNTALLEENKKLHDKIARSDRKRKKSKARLKAMEKDVALSHARGQALKVLQRQIDDNTHENDLILQQMQQLQEELVLQSHIKPLHQLSSANSSSGAVNTDATNSITIDFRDHIDGDNWYYAEDDGRWAGPRSTSSLRLPPLPAGQYRMELVIVDAMSPDLLRGMRVLVNGQAVKLQWRGRLASRLGPFARLIRRNARYPLTVHAHCNLSGQAGSEGTNMSFQFPGTISPAGSGSDDLRHMAIRVQSLKFRPSS